MLNILFSFFFFFFLIRKFYLDHFVLFLFDSIILAFAQPWTQLAFFGFGERKEKKRKEKGPASLIADTKVHFESEPGVR